MPLAPEPVTMTETKAPWLLRTLGRALVARRRQLCARGVLTCVIVVGSALIVSFAGDHWHVRAGVAPYLPSSDTVLSVIVTPIAFVAVVLEALAPILLPLLVGAAVWSLVNAVRSQRGGRSAAPLHS